MFTKIGEGDFIPCLLFKGSSKKFMLHFHGNAEDISHTVPLLNKISKAFNINILAVEYPSYGIYKYNGKVMDKIKSDSEQIILTLKKTLRVGLDDIIICGRTIGSGPAIHLASKFSVSCLVLITPMKSLKDLTQKTVGKFASFFTGVGFDNMSLATGVKCPVCIIHGLKDFI